VCNKSLNCIVVCQIYSVAIKILALSLEMLRVLFQIDSMKRLLAVQLFSELANNY